MFVVRKLNRELALFFCLTEFDANCLVYRKRSAHLRAEQRAGGRPYKLMGRSQ